jgi:hypothetical protein
MDPLASDCLPSGPGKTVAASTDIGLPDPADALAHAPLTDLVPRRVRAPTWPNAI